MKYMGSKRSMLTNGLGELIVERSQDARRIVDLFCGASSVSWFAAEKIQLPVLAVDLQKYAVILARAVIGRTGQLDPQQLASEWLDEVKLHREESRYWHAAIILERQEQDTNDFVTMARLLCQRPSEIGPIWNAYGGHYVSPAQAITLDYMIRYCPNKEPQKSVCLAALISAACKCVAAPGHTAQPLQPTERAGKFIQEAWSRDPLLVCEKELHRIGPKYALVTGKAFVSNALEVAPRLRDDDLVVIDPPYSGVQYSRFYHVLETIARGEHIPVSGVGRYPPLEERPQSDFSKKGQSKRALRNLLSSLATTGATLIFTFPEGESSNGLSGDFVMETAATWYNVTKSVINGQFSTLGGNNSKRASRKPSSELLLLMQCR